MSELNEFERAINHTSLQMEGRIWGHSPVQAEGTIAGKAFYFRARYEGWTFSLAESENIDPVDISFAEQGFFREASYGKSHTFAASYMPYDEAKALINICAQEYLNSLSF